MVLGVFPSAALLEKYNLPCVGAHLELRGSARSAHDGGRSPHRYFVPICRAVDLGDISTFESKLAELQVYFIRCGSYLLVERSKTICYRNFFKRVQQTMRALQPDETHHIIDINKFMRCLGVVGVEMDVEVSTEMCTHACVSPALPPATPLHLPCRRSSACWPT